jgi:hypothetical protein
VNRFLTAALAALVVLAPAPAPAQTSFSTGGPSANARLATPTGRSTVTTDAITGINAMSARPTPSSPGYTAVRPDMQWVPDRYVSVPGAPEGVLVPGHWERRVSEHEVYVPPLPVEHPRGAPELIHGGFRPPVEERNSP